MDNTIRYMQEATLELGGNGIFLTAGEQKPNTMTIGWGSLGIYWRLPVFIALVRPSRFTYALLDEAGEFTVSIPAPGQMERELAFCGSASGRDIDKYQALGIATAPARNVKTAIISDCAFHYECRVIYRQKLDIQHLPAQIQQYAYPQGDGHTLFYGQIVSCYP